MINLKLPIGLELRPDAVISATGIYIGLWDILDTYSIHALSTLSLVLDVRGDW